MTPLQTVTFMARRKVSRLVPTNAYLFKAKPRWDGRRGRIHVWLQSKAWEFLHRAGALTMHSDTKVDYVRHVIDADSFIERFNAASNALYQWTASSARTLLIGAEDYDELMRSPAAIDQEFTFKAMMRLKSHSEPSCYGPSVFGFNELQLTVHVIPWMRGYVVLP